MKVQVDKSQVTFENMKLGEACWYKNCLFVRVDTYGEVNAVCLKNDEVTKVPYAAHIRLNAIVTPATVVVTFE